MATVEDHMLAASEATQNAPPHLDSASTHRIGLILAFRDNISLGSVSYTLIATHPAARIFLEISRETLTPLKEWSIVTARSIHSPSTACLASLKDVGTRDVYRHIYCDMRDEAKLVRRLKAMAWWLTRVPAVDLSMHCIEPVIGEALKDVLMNVCGLSPDHAELSGVTKKEEEEEEEEEGGNTDNTPDSAVAWRSVHPHLRRVYLEDLSSVSAQLLVSFLYPFREQLHVMRLKEAGQPACASLSFLSSGQYHFTQLRTLSLSRCCLPPLLQLLVCFPDIENLALESCDVLPVGKGDTHLKITSSSSSSSSPSLFEIKTESDSPTLPSVTSTTPSPSLSAAVASDTALSSHEEDFLCHEPPSHTRITWLTLSGNSTRYMSNYVWIRHLSQLQYLELSHSQQPVVLSELLYSPESNSAALPRLRTLILAGTGASDLSALVWTPQLEVLDLRYCTHVTSVDVFKTATCAFYLRVLSLDGTRLTSVDALAPAFCPVLEELSLENCHEISSFAALAGSQSLIALNVAATNVSELTWLVGMPALTRLRIDHCAQLRGGAMRSTAVLHALREMRAQSSPITSLKGWSACAALEDIDLSHCALLRHVDGLSGAPQLRQLTMSHALSLTRVDGLGRCPVLAVLVLDNCAELTSLEGLDGLVSLKTLSVVKTAITRLPHGCTGLDSVNANNCTELVDVSGLSAAPHLTFFCTSQNVFDGLSGLGATSVLSRLRLDHCIVPERELVNFAFLKASGESLRHLTLKSIHAVRELTGLSCLSALTVLSLDDCIHVTDLAPLALCHALSHVSIDNTAVRTLQPLRGCVQLKSISLCGCQYVTSLDGLGPSITSIRALCVGLTSLDAVREMDSLGSLGVSASDDVQIKDVKNLLASRRPGCTLLMVSIRLPNNEVVRLMQKKPHV